jgi:hypothetical protein
MLSLKRLDILLLLDSVLLLVPLMGMWGRVLMLIVMLRRVVWAIVCLGRIAVLVIVLPPVVVGRTGHHCRWSMLPLQRDWLFQTSTPPVRQRGMEMERRNGRVVTFACLLSLSDGRSGLDAARVVVSL